MGYFTQQEPVCHLAMSVATYSSFLLHFALKAVGQPPSSFPSGIDSAAT